MFPRSRDNRARIPEGVRLYAIGDVHGRADLLEHVLESIDADRTAHPASRTVEIFLGDYIDRGPQSRQVLDRLIARSQVHEVVCLKGNHETYIASILSDPAVLSEWRLYGGFETLLSYGVVPSLNLDADEQAKLSEAFGHALPESHRQFLDRLRTSFTCGDFFFAHAGVRPGVPLAEQREQDLLWIREDFLLCNEDFGKVIVHGHTPVREPDIRPNRINIDTGAYATGQLTCLILEKDEIHLI